MNFITKTRKDENTKNSIEISCFRDENIYFVLWKLRI
jgi:hypothetical protein